LELAWFHQRTFLDGGAPFGWAPIGYVADVPPALQRIAAIGGTNRACGVAALIHWGRRRPQQLALFTISGSRTGPG
jgi:hypothetical protein